MTQPPEPPEFDLPESSPPLSDGESAASAGAGEGVEPPENDSNEPTDTDEISASFKDEDEWAEIWELEPELETEPEAPPPRQPRRRQRPTPAPDASVPSQQGPQLAEKSTLTRLVVRLLRTLSRSLEWTAVVLETDPQPDESANPIIRLFQRAATDGQPVAEGIWEGWTNRVLPQIRVILPGGLRESLSDRALTGILAGALIALFVVLPNFAPRGPQAETQISEAPPAVEQPADEETPTPPPSTEVEPPGSETSEPEPEVEPEPEPEVEPEPEAEPEPEEEPEAEPEPEVTPTPSPPPAVTPSPEPSPPAVLTPEQSLVASIEKRVAEVGDRYTQGLVIGVRTNFRQNMLTIRLSDDWYDLPYAQQDKLAADLLKQANRLDFNKVELGDRIGYRLARNPVVGDAMVILRREKANFVP